MSDSADNKLVKKDDGDEEPKKEGVVRWALGWVAIPGAIIGAIFTAGAVVGANYHDAWFTRAIVWCVEVFW